MCHTRSTSWWALVRLSQTCGCQIYCGIGRTIIYCRSSEHKISDSQKNDQKSCLRAEEHLQVWLFQTNNRFCISPPRSACTLTVQDSGAEASSNLRDLVWKSGPKSLEQSVRPVSPYRRRREALITASAWSLKWIPVNVFNHFYPSLLYIIYGHQWFGFFAFVVIDMWGEFYVNSTSVLILLLYLLPVTVWYHQARGLVQLVKQWKTDGR